MDDPLSILKEQKNYFFLAGYSALDKYFKIKYPAWIYINTDATLIELAQIFENLEYPGLPLEDASVQCGGTRYIFRCVDEVKKVSGVPFTVLKLLYDLKREVFLDGYGIRKNLREGKLVETVTSCSGEVVLMEAAKLISRFHYKIPADFSYSPQYNIPLDVQRNLLNFILLSPYSPAGLSLLSKSGFIEKFWPEIHDMADVKQTKDYHPEGDVWQHTLETLKYRKKINLTLSLALLFHDIGKPLARGIYGTQEQPFKEHSYLGMKVARRFLKRLGYGEQLITDVSFLIRYHMMPHALKKLPLFRTEKVMDSPLFPLLLEVYRADASSSFVGPGGYYDACRVYKKYLKNKKNPFRKNNTGRNFPGKQIRR